MVRPVDSKARDQLGGKALGVGEASINEQAQFYAEFWKAWHEKYRTILSMFYHFDEKSRMFMVRRALARYVGPGQGRTVFDLGRGLGRLARALQALNWNTSAIDLSPATIAQLSECYPAIDWHSGDMFSYQGFKYGDYDLVTSSEVRAYPSGAA